jgi:hypothetical protein
MTKANSKRTATPKQSESKLVLKFTVALEHYSPQMTALIGAILGHDFGVRTRKGHQLVGLSITSDGFVIGSTDPVSSGAFIGAASDLSGNLMRLLEDAKLTDAEYTEYKQRYEQHVTDWRTR